MLNELSNTFSSNIKSLEMLYLLENIKPAVRIMVKEDEKEKITDFLKKNNLNYEISDFKLIKQDTEKAYSDKATKIALDSKHYGHLIFYISKDQETSKKAKELEQENKHKELGILLGYPKCCSEFFEKHFEEESKKQNDYTLPALNNSEGFNFSFYTNIALRHFDLNLLSHFPCNFNCSASIELAKKHLEILKKHDDKAYEIAKEISKTAVLYTETNGVFLLKNPELKDNKLYYKGIKSSKNNQLYESLKSSEHIEIMNKKRIKINGLEIKNIGVMLFS